MRIWRGIKNHFVPSADNAYRPRLLHRPWLLFFLAVTLATEGFLVANLVARQTDQNFLAAVVPAEVIALTNTEREHNSVGDVTRDALLQNAAQAKADDMAQKGYFSHVAPDGKTPWQWISESGYRYQYAGENLAVRFIDSKDVVSAWMQSPTHRENMVKPVYTDIGVGVAQGSFEGEPATYIVQYFASPAAVASNEAQASLATPTLAQAPAAQTPAPGSEQVEGASVAPVISQNNPASPETSSRGGSFIQTVTRQLARVFANPLESSAWVLGSVAALLILVLGLTFFMHMQVQPGTTLASGVLVAALALSFLAINSRLVEGGISSAPNPAGVIEASRPGAVHIGQKAESTGYALFPQVP